MTTPTLVEALAVVTGGSVGSHATAFRVINDALAGSWFSARLAHEAPPGTDVDDVKQKLMLSLLRSNQRPFEGTTDEQARAFLGTIAVRRAIDTDRTRRKREVKISEDRIIQVPSQSGPYDAIVAADVTKRLEELVTHAGTIRESPSSDVLVYHLRRILLGVSASDSQPGADDKARARLRQERSRSLALLREAHEASIEAEKHLGRPDELDRVVERVLETPKTMKSRYEPE